jgi:hypothetical protein
MGMDNLLWLASSMANAAVIGLLLYRRVWRTLPFFCIYCAWNLLDSAGAYAVLHFYPASYFTAYLSGTAIDSALEICVLIELAWSVLRPLRASLPRSALVVVTGFVVALGAAIWPFAVIPGFNNLPANWHFLMHLQQTTSIFRILFFLALAGGSQLLSIGWRNRELQVATGLGIYSFVSIAVAMLHTHQTMGPQYNFLDEVEVASYFCSLLYWGFSFAQQEAERRAFTPQMQNFLLAMAGTARSTRLALIDSSAGKGRRHGE